MARIRFGTAFANEANGFIATIPDGSEAWKIERRSKTHGGGVEVSWLVREVVPQVPPTLTEEQLDQIAAQIAQQREALREEHEAFVAANEPIEEYPTTTYEEIDADALRANPAEEQARRELVARADELLDDEPVAAV